MTKIAIVLITAMLVLTIATPSVIAGSEPAVDDLSVVTNTTNIQETRTNDEGELLQFTSSGHVLGFGRNNIVIASTTHMLRIDFLNSRTVAPEVDGDISQQNSTGAANPFGTVIYRDIWDGVTVFYETDKSSIVKSTYYVDTTEGRDKVDRIRLGYNRPVRIDEHGNLVVTYEDGTMVDSTPTAWQEVEGQRKLVTAAFTLYSEREVGFSLGDYIPGIPVVIDPEITWNTFLGSGSRDYGNSIALDSSGNIYITGTSEATWDSPVQAYTSSFDAFVAKLDGSGNFIWNTFLGSSSYDRGLAISVDTSGNVYVTGESRATWGSPVRAYTSGSDTFVAKLNSSGNLTWNTFLGSSGGDEGDGIAVDSSGNVYITGQSHTTWGSPVQDYTSGSDTFVAKLNNSGNLTWNTFLGSSGDDKGNDITVDNSGNVFVTGFSAATWGSPVRAYTSGSDAFAAKLNNGGSLIWNTFLGSSNDDEGDDIAVDNSGNVFITGFSTAAWGSPVRAYTSGSDAFAVKLNSNGNLTWNTFLGGRLSDYGHDIAVDNSGNVYITGASYFTWGSPVQDYSDRDDAFVAKLDSGGNLTWNTFLGGYIYDGNYLDYGKGIAVDGNGTIFVTGYSDASWGSPMRVYSGGDYDAFVASFDGNGNLTWNTFLGGGHDYDRGSGIALDGNGNIFITGISDATWGSPVRDYSDSDDAFIAKLDSDGNLTWNTFLGGSGCDRCNGIAVDGSGSVFITGCSNASWGSPVRDYSDNDDAFVAKLDSSGNLTWNTFLGGKRSDYGHDIAVDSGGNIFITGASYAIWGSPVWAFPFNDNAFVARLDGNGNLTWNTFLGFDGDDSGHGIAVDSGGNIFVTGYSDASWGSPVRAYSGGDYDAFVARLNSDGNVIWNTFLGGSGFDRCNDIAIDSSGNSYVTGYSSATWGSPVRAFSSSNYNGYRDAFVAKLDSGGNFAWNTFLGGGIGEDRGYSIAIDGSGIVYVTGQSLYSWGSPVQAHSDEYWPLYDDAFVANVDSNGNLILNTFLGRDGGDSGHGIAVDSSGTFYYVTGYSDDTWGSPVQAYSTGYDTFVAKLEHPEYTAPTAAITYSVPGPYKEGDSVTITATFSEPMADSPVVQIAIWGSGVYVYNTNMTKIDSTHYTYVCTIDSEAYFYPDWTATVWLSSGRDLAGNPIISTPTSGATFTLYHREDEGSSLWIVLVSVFGGLGILVVIGGTIIIIRRRLSKDKVA